MHSGIRGVCVTAYAAFFHGLNVGGKNRVKMPLLRQMLQGLGLSSVQTYIQSGNAVFASDEAAETLRTRIERGFAEAFGFESRVTLRTAEEISTILSELPFPAERLSEAAAATDAVTLYALLYDEPPVQDAVSRAVSAYPGQDTACLLGRTVYLLVFQSIRDSKLSQALHKAAPPVTVRNWNTLQKLSGLLSAI